MLGPFLDPDLLDLYLLANPPLTNCLIDILCSRPLFWFVSQTLINELIYLSWALLRDFAISQPTTLWLLMCHNLPKDDAIAENVCLQEHTMNSGDLIAIVDAPSAVAASLFWSMLLSGLIGFVRQACCYGAKATKLAQRVLASP